MFRAVLSRRINLAAPWRFRFFSSQTEGETRISSILKEKFPTAESIDVSDISGGCGAMYEITIVSDEFKGKRTVMQHRMVNQYTTTEIHGENDEYYSKYLKKANVSEDAKRRVYHFSYNKLPHHEEALAEEVKQMHGLRIQTFTTEQAAAS